MEVKPSAEADILEFNRDLEVQKSNVMVPYKDINETQTLTNEIKNCLSEKNALILFSFEKMHLHRYNFDTRMDDIDSTRLMSRLGFTGKCARRKFIRKEDGTWHSWGRVGNFENEYYALGKKGSLSPI
jgi:hypothetical protein